MSRALGLVPLLLVLGAPAARAGQSQIYLTWRAPYGSARAVDNITWNCKDSTRVDTLFVTFDPGRNSKTFNGFTSTLMVYPAPGDTLPPYWRAGSTGARPLVEMQSDPDPSLPCPLAWQVAGLGRAMYASNSQFGRLDLIHAVGTKQSTPVDSGTVYCLARLLVRHGNPALEGCRKPICIEWSRAGLAFRLGEDQRVKVGGVRYASINSPGCRVCDEYRAHVPTPAWTPPRMTRPPAPAPPSPPRPDSAGRDTTKR